MAIFEIADALTHKNEGGWNNVSGDRGGETYCGIARNFWPKWEGWLIVDRKKPLSNGAIIKDPALEILRKKFYKKEFWDKVGGDEIEDQPTANTLYDFAVNANFPPSIRNIQNALGLATTGKITPELITAINHPEKYFI